MIRTTILPAAGLLAATLLIGAPTAAAGETCRGESATLVGSPQTLNLTGTEARDVVVTNGSQMLWALGGDDLVCVTGYGAQVFAGDGDDIVDATMLSGRYGAQVRLGAGSDRFEGSPAGDVVWAGTEDTFNTPAVDTERDVILTGAPSSSSSDRDSVVSGQDGIANDDEIRMDGGFLRWAGIPTPATVLDGGSDSHLGLRAGADESIALDNVTGTLAVDSQPLLRFTGFTGFSLEAQGPKSFRFHGSARDEQLNLYLSDAQAHTVGMGGGDDRLQLYSIGKDSVAARTSYDGGSGRDLLELVLPDEVDVDLDLARGRLSTGRKAVEVTVPARRFEHASVMAKDVELAGTSGRNTLRVYACRSKVKGRAGKDRLTTYDEVMDEGLPCRRPKARFFGGRGHDVLVGSRGPDRLIGGPGRDRLDGRQGRDVCQGEKMRRCEVRR